MRFFNKKDEPTIDEPQLVPATRLGLSLAEIEKLSVGKSCPKYGTSEILHLRKVRGGKIVVFNISEKYRSEKISEGRKKIKAQKLSADGSVDEKDKK
jgi:hypothetical protein